MSEFDSEYLQLVAACVAQLKAGWQSLEVPESEQEQELIRIRNTAKQVWLTAVKHVQEEKQQIKRQIQSLYDQLCQLKQQLQGCNMDQDLLDETNQVLQEVECEGYLRQLLCKLQQFHELWTVQKQFVVDEIIKVKNEVRQYQILLGLEEEEDMQDLNTQNANLQNILNGQHRVRQQLYQQKLVKEEQLRRELMQVQSICSRLGENYEVLLEKIHPHLYAFSTNKTMTETFGVILDDMTISAVAQMKDTLLNDEMMREAGILDLKTKMQSLWSQLEIPSDDQARAQFKELFSSTYRLHADIIEQFEQEVGRLLNAKISRARGQLKSKLKDLYEMCESTHLPALPQLQQLTPSHIHLDLMEEEIINKLLINVGHVQEQIEEQVAKRAPILKLIEEVSAVTAEVQWLAEYEKDDNRFKGRDSNRRLQRALKAGKQRLRLPALVKKAVGILEEWEAQNGPFQYHQHVSYLEDVLLVQLRQIETKKEKQQQSRSNSRQKSLNKPVPQRTSVPPKLTSRTLSVPYNRQVQASRSTKSIANPYPSSQCGSNKPVLKGTTVQKASTALTPPTTTTHSGNSFASISTPISKKSCLPKEETESLFYKKTDPLAFDSSHQTQFKEAQIKQSQFQAQNKIQAKNAAKIIQDQIQAGQQNQITEYKHDENLETRFFNTSKNQFDDQEDDTASKIVGLNDMMDEEQVQTDKDDENSNQFDNNLVDQQQDEQNIGSNKSPNQEQTKPVQQNPNFNLINEKMLNNVNSVKHDETGLKIFKNIDSIDDEENVASAEDDETGLKILKNVDSIEDEETSSKILRSSQDENLITEIIAADSMKNESHSFLKEQVKNRQELKGSCDVGELKGSCDVGGKGKDVSETGSDSCQSGSTALGNNVLQPLLFNN